MDNVKWMPIESAPKDGTYFLAYNKHGKCEYGGVDLSFEVAFFESPKDKDPCGLYGYSLHSTHWTPLPGPPTDKSE